ncbi:hypothetical protein Tco_1278233 [Tanacetum coccineum]
MVPTLMVNKSKLKCLDKRQLIEGKLLLVDDDGKPLPKVVSIVNVDSNSEVEEEFDEYTTFMASTETKQDDDYDCYDDDMYDSHDMYDNLHTICVEFDIEIPGRKKK